MRFGANVLRGARPIPLDRPIPGTGPSAPALGAVLARHRTPILVGSAGVVVALGLMRRRNATSGAGPDLAAMGDPAANGATVAGYNPADTSGTDVYNALQPQIEETQSMLSQLLGAIGAGSLLPSSSSESNPAAAPAAGSRRPRRPKAAAKPRGRGHAKAKGRGHAKGGKSHGKGKAAAHGRPRSRFSTLAPAGRSTPRRAASPAPHKAHRDTAHVVRKGETAASIAKKHGTNPAALHKANSRLAPAKVTPGRRVVVPNPKARRR